LELGSAQQLVTIEGTPPNLLNPPKGCPFAARCEYCMEICVEEFPPEYTFETGHTAACWLHHPESGYQGMDFSKDKL
jgi:oligopeptide transport system ATP-binding protein